MGHDSRQACPSLPLLFAFVEDPTCFSKQQAESLEGHIDSCDKCTEALELSDRRACRLAYEDLAYKVRNRVKSRGLWRNTVVFVRRSIPVAAAVLIRICLSSVFLLVLLGMVLGGVALACVQYFWPIFPRDHVEPVVVQTIESERQEFVRARFYNIQEAGPGRLRILLNPFLRPPYYNGLKIIWDCGAFPPQNPEDIYIEGWKPLDPLVEHVYDLPPPGEQRQVKVLFRFYIDGLAMERFKVRDFIDETVDLVVTSRGIEFSAAPRTSAASGRFIEPKEGEAVGEQFSVKFTLRPPRSPDTTGGMIHLLIHAIDGSEDVQAHYFALPFQLKVDELAVTPGEKKFAVGASLRWILMQLSDEATKPTRFEILIVQLPFKIIDWSISREKLLGLVGLEKSVLDRLEIVLAREGQPANR